MVLEVGKGEEGDDVPDMIEISAVEFEIGMRGVVAK